MAVVNIGLATEVLKFCDELCVNWKSAVESRDRLGKVKAQSYIDKYESKLCDACVASEAALDFLDPTAAKRSTAIGCTMPEDGEADGAGSAGGGSDGAWYLYEN